MEERIYSSLGKLLDAHRYPSVEHKCAWLMEHCAAVAPTSSETIEMMFEGRSFQFNAGQFWYSILPNWTGGRRGSWVKIPDDQKRELEERCPWIRERVDAIVEKKHEKPMGDPSVEQKCAWLMENYAAAAPKYTETIDMMFKGHTYHFRCGNFLDSIMKCWTGDRGPLTQEQKRELEERCPWMKERVIRRTQNQNG